MHYFLSRVVQDLFIFGIVLFLMIDFTKFFATTNIYKN